jgi:hypothetical protein
MSTPSGGRSGGVRIEDLDALVALGADVADLGGRATRARHVVADAAGAPAAFGDYAGGVAFGAHHDAVVEVFSSTFEALATDVQAFGDNITSSARAFRDADDSVQASLTSLSGVLPASAPSGSAAAFVQARERQGRRLTAVDVAPEQAADVGASRQAVEHLVGSDPASSPEPAAGGYDAG